MNVSGPFTLALVLAAASLPAQLTLVDEDFDSGFGDWSLYVTENGSLGTFGLATSPFGTGSAASFNVGQIVYESGAPAGGGLRLDLFLEGETDLDFSFDFGAQAGSLLNSDGGTVSFFLDGGLVTSWAAGPLAAGESVQARLEGTIASVSAGNHELTIQFDRAFRTASHTPRQFIDNFLLQGFALEQIQRIETAIPEPTTAGLAGILGVAGLLLARRRR